tara:strand:- start:846 stop:2204 length:1359 start_codon:yes stop_codon:yes gene_type:complete
MLEFLDDFLIKFVDFMWGTPLLVLILGGGLYFTLYSKFIPFKYLKHAIDILFGKYDNKNDPGRIPHYQALSSALASTVGMGNISGVAVALHLGGSGAIFWMWVSALVGMSTKFFTCSLAIMYRGKDDSGELQGGPMYVITEGMGEKFKPLAVLFSIAGLFGCLSLFQSNQLTQIIREELFFSNNFLVGHITFVNFSIGIVSALAIGLITFGGIKRIGLVASKLVPVMVIIYFITGSFILAMNINQIPSIMIDIVNKAISRDALSGGILGSVIIIGIKRAAFSNEAGIGTEAMAHGAAKTREPIREGLVAMLGPFIDTIIVCTLTALIILVSGVDLSESNGVTLTTAAFKKELGIIGQYILILCVIIFSLTTMLGYSYYGTKCSSFLFGTKSKKKYRYIYILSIIIGAMASLDMIINFLDGMFAIMAIPTIISSVYLSSNVMERAAEYFKKIN